MRRTTYLVGTCIPHTLMALILVVDHDTAVRHFLQFVLERAGHQVLEASNGRDAMEICRKPLDLVITALFMPVQDGYETIEKLRKEYPGLRIIAMSDGFRDFQQAVLIGMAIKLGAKTGMQKPLSADMVLETVEKVLASK
jgi:CheY-like chemotaxis protein